MVAFFEKDKLLHRPDGKAVEATVVVGWIDPSTIEVQIVAARLRVERRAPVEAERAVTVETRPVAVTRSWEEDAVAVDVAREATTCHTVLVGPF